MIFHRPVTRKQEEACAPGEAFLPLPATEEALFVRREKRFLVLCEKDGKEFWIHSNNTGAMTGLTRRGARILASRSDNPGRRLSHTLEAVYSTGAGGWVGVNTSVPNRMLARAFLAGALPFAAGCSTLRTEATRGTSRFDGLFTGEGLPPLWVECKNVTLVEECVAYFPDARSERGCRHLHDLCEAVDAGERAAMFYLVQRPDARCFGPADFVHPDYAELFWTAVDRGVEIWAFRADVSPAGVRLAGRLPLVRRPRSGHLPF